MTTSTARHSAHPWIAEADSRVRFGIFGGPGDPWVREVERTAWGRIGTVLDPDGNYLQVIDNTGRRA